jgi:hypothetical protein
MGNTIDRSSSSHGTKAYKVIADGVLAPILMKFNRAAMSRDITA